MKVIRSHLLNKTKTPIWKKPCASSWKCSNNKISNNNNSYCNFTKKIKFISEEMMQC
jgi:hypothetical protein